MKTHLARRKPYAPKEPELPCGFFPHLISGSKILLLWEQWGFSFTVSWNMFLTFTVSSFATIHYPDSQKNKRESPETKADQNESFTKRARRKTTGRRICTGNILRIISKPTVPLEDGKKPQQAWFLHSLKMIMSLNRHSVHSSTRQISPFTLAHHQCSTLFCGTKTDEPSNSVHMKLILRPQQTQASHRKTHLLFSSRLWLTKRFVIQA